MGSHAHSFARRGTPLAIVSFAAGLPDLQATRFAADIRDDESVHRHILEMADMLSDGIIRQSRPSFDETGRSR
jgi:hypothetical protein